MADCEPLTMLTGNAWHQVRHWRAEHKGVCKGLCAANEVVDAHCKGPPPSDVEVRADICTALKSAFR
eukprot:15686-Eustigmatos_ZCMA.PRE.1